MIGILQLGQTEQYCLCFASNVNAENSQYKEKKAKADVNSICLEIHVSIK